MARLHDPSTGLVASFAFSLAVPFFFLGSDEGTISVPFRDRSFSTVARIETKVFFFRPRPGLCENPVLERRARQLSLHLEARNDVLSFPYPPVGRSG